MEKYIAVTKETRDFLIKAFRTNGVTVWRALTFAGRGGDSPLAARIRKAAYERGGILMAMAPAMETMHDHDGYMRQYFPNGVMMECNKLNSHVDIIKDGDVVRSYDDVTIPQLYEIQAIAGGM